MKYIVIEFPQSQDLFNIEDWQEHCYLINDEKGLETFGSSAYFVEEDWYNKHFN